MKVGVVLFPGSNCAADIKTFFERRGDKCSYIWYKQNNINDFDIDLLVFLVDLPLEIENIRKLQVIMF